MNCSQCHQICPNMQLQIAPPCSLYSVSAKRSLLNTFLAFQSVWHGTLELLYDSSCCFPTCPSPCSHHPQLTNPTAAQLVVTFQPLTVVTSWSLTVSGTTAMSGAWCPTHPEDLGRRSQGTLHPCTTLLCQMQQAETFLMAKHLLRLHSCK